MDSIAKEPGVLTTIEKLLVLQDRDRKIRQLSRELEDIPARKKLIETRLNEHRDALRQAQDELKKKQASAKNLDVEIESQKGRILKLREQQGMIKTNEEYRAIEREIAGIQKQIKDIEDQEIAIMEEAETLGARVKDLESNLKNEETYVKSDWAAQDERMKNMRIELDQVTQVRSELVGDIDASWLSRYERTFRHTGDFALVPIENGACGGCHMKLPPQVAQDVKKGAAMNTCSFCGRLLYWRV
jgi:hypothetical protein